MTYANWTTLERGRQARVPVPYRALGTLVCEAIVHTLAAIILFSPLAFGAYQLLALIGGR